MFRCAPMLPKINLIIEFCRIFRHYKYKAALRRPSGDLPCHSRRVYCAFMACIMLLPFGVM